MASKYRLDQNEHDWLIRLGQLFPLKKHVLTEFEQKFLADVLAVFRSAGADTKISAKQWDILTQISDKIIA